MEGGPKGLETAPGPDLLEAYAEREITLFGHTGTFRELGAMCPLDLSSLPLEDKNDFVVKAANEAGLEIAPEHKAVFTETSERLKLERKFTIAPASRDSVMEVSPSHTQRKNIITEARKPKEEKTAIRMPELSASNDRELSEHQEYHLPTAPATVISKEILDSARASQPVEQTPHTATPISVEREAYNNVQYEQALIEHIAYDIHTPPINAEVTAIAAQAALAAEPSVGTVIPSVELLTPDFSIGEATIMFDQAADNFGDSPLYGAASPAVRIEVPESLPPISQETAEASAAAWAAELGKEPIDLYEDFSMALSNFAELQLSDPLHSENGEQTTTQPESNEYESIEAAPLHIVAIISERLAELEPDTKELVIPIIQNIVGALHGIKVLEARRADTEMITTVEIQLEELCTKLFATIGREYDEQDVKQFMHVMLHPEFKPTKLPERKLDLEHTGTREVKHFVQRASDDLADIDHYLQHLGRAAVSYARDAAIPLLAA